MSPVAELANVSASPGKSSGTSTNAFCDVCWGRPHKQGMTFQQCRICRVGVHNECYGIPGEVPAKPNFTCRACQAVGTTVTVRQRHPTNARDSSHSPPPSQQPPPRLSFQVTERPTECCLCSVDDGNDWYHAMHPVYDHYGPTGRQLVLPPDAEHLHARLAWGHTLCCFALNSHSRTAGCVYGCTADGGYEGDDSGAAEDNSDTSSINPDLVPDAKEEKEEVDDSIHHFVYCLKTKKSDADSVWTKTIQEQQKLKCQICGADDRPANSYRIPVQCSANDPSEFADFATLHPNLGNDTCYVSMHVGCSIWGRNDAGQLPTCRQVYYFPGRDDSLVNQQQQSIFTTTVTNIFCPVHAQDLVRGKIPGADRLRYPAHMVPPKGRPVAAGPPPAAPVHPTRTTVSLARAVQRRGQSRFLTQGRGNWHIADAPSRLGLRLLDDRIIPATAPTKKRKAAAAHRKNTTTTTSTTTTAQAATSAAAHQRAQHQAAAVRERAFRRRLRADLVESLASAVVDRTPNSDQVEQIRKQRRTYWKQRWLTWGTGNSAQQQPQQLTLPQFKVLWREVWEQEVATELANDTSSPSQQHDDSLAPIRRPSKLVLGETARCEERGLRMPSKDRSPTQSVITPTANADLIETILNEIIAMEKEGREHLDAILTKSESRWRKQLLLENRPPSEFQVLWETVLKDLLGMLEYSYSSEEFDWTSISVVNGNTVDPHLKWETVEILCVGHVPDTLIDL